MAGTLRFAAFVTVFCLFLVKILSSGAYLQPRLGGGQSARASSVSGLVFAGPVKLDRVDLPGSMDEVRIAANGGGQFLTDVEVNGARIRQMVVDTGATLVELSYEDAASAGFHPGPSDYKYQVMTANGAARVARVRLTRVRIGNVFAYDVDALVADRGALSGSLLGMSFLAKLRSFSVESGTLALRR